jgi:DNA-binding transcriptional MerR regulator
VKAPGEEQSRNDSPSAPRDPLITELAKAESDLERIRHIRELRDTAGFSLAEIGQLLEDEDGRAANRAAYHATEDTSARAEILTDSLARVERAIGILQAKTERLHAMVAEAQARRDRIRAKLDALTVPESADSGR